jgi:hypothetical protein
MWRSAEDRPMSARQSIALAIAQNIVKPPPATPPTATTAQR